MSDPFTNNSISLLVPAFFVTARVLTICLFYTISSGKVLNSLFPGAVFEKLDSYLQDYEVEDRMGQEGWLCLNIHFEHQC